MESPNRCPSHAEVMAGYDRAIASAQQAIADLHAIYAEGKSERQRITDEACAAIRAAKGAA